MQDHNYKIEKNAIEEYEKLENEVAAFAITELIHEIEEKLKNNLKDHKCSWKQRGPEIFCDTGNYEHGMRIPTSKRLAKTGEGGEPILVDIVFQQ